MRLLMQLGAVAVVALAGSLLVGAVSGIAVLTLRFGLATAVLALLTYAWVVRGLFGTDVSGTEGTRGLLGASLSGPTALSGGAFGPEASLPAVLAGAALTVAFLVLARRRGRIATRTATLVP